MQKVFKENRENLLFNFLLFSMLFFTFYKLIVVDPLIDYDDKMFIEGLQKINSISDYFQSIKNGLILDIQPIKDFSHFIDIKFKNLIPFYSFHLINLLIWILVCNFFKRILEVLGGYNKRYRVIIWSLVFLYAISPVSVSSVAWIAARKHLLSTLFITWATYLFLKHRSKEFNLKLVITICSLFFLSCFSHPINLFWPLFVFAISSNDQSIRRNRTLLISLGIISIITLIINTIYFNGIYISITGGDGKFSTETNSIGTSFLALGRYLYLTIFPFNALPVPHYPGSWENIVGLVLIPIFIYITLKKIDSKNRGEVICFMLYFLLPLIPVTLKITRIFCSDTYLLNSSLGIYIVIFFMVKDLKWFWREAILLPYIIFLFIYSQNYVGIFENRKKFWEYSYNKETTPESIIALASIYISENEHSKGSKLVDQLEMMEPENRSFIKLKAENIYYNPFISDQEKITSLEMINPKRPIVYLFLALLYSHYNNLIELKKNIFKVFSEPEIYIVNSYLKNEHAVAAYEIICEKNKISSECQKNLLEFKKKVRFKNWNQNLYQQMKNKYRHDFKLNLY